MKELFWQKLSLWATEGVFGKPETARVEPWGKLSTWRAHSRVLKSVQILWMQVIEVYFTSLILLSLSCVDIFWCVISIRHMEMVGLAKNRRIMRILRTFVHTYINLWILVRWIVFLIGRRMCSQQRIALEMNICKLGATDCSSSRARFKSRVRRKGIKSHSFRNFSLRNSFNPTSFLHP